MMLRILLITSIIACMALEILMARFIGTVSETLVNLTPNKRDDSPSGSYNDNTTTYDSFTLTEQATSVERNHANNTPQFQPKIIGGFPICLTDPDATYCELDRSYPSTVIDEAFKSSAFSDPSKFLEDRIKEPGVASADVNIDDKGNVHLSVITENTVQSTCPFREIMIYPPVAKSKTSSNWVYVVNNDDYRQGVKGQKCDTISGKSCNADTPTLYESSCIQRFKDTNLLAIDPQTKNPYKDSFSVPSHCECQTYSEIFLKEKTADPA